MTPPVQQARDAGWLTSLHPTAWEEVEAMARATRKGLKIDVRPAIEYVGLKNVLEQIGVDRVVEALGTREVIKRIGVHGLLANLTAAQRRELKRLLQ